MVNLGDRVIYYPHKKSPPRPLPHLDELRGILEKDASPGYIKIRVYPKFDKRSTYAGIISITFHVGSIVGDSLTREQQNKIKDYIVLDPEYGLSSETKRVHRRMLARLPRSELKVSSVSSNRRSRSINSLSLSSNSRKSRKRRQ